MSFPMRTGIISRLVCYFLFHLISIFIMSTHDKVFLIDLIHKYLRINISLSNILFCLIWRLVCNTFAPKS